MCVLDKIKTDYLTLCVGNSSIYTVHGSEAGTFRGKAHISVIAGEEAAYNFQEHPP